MNTGGIYSTNEKVIIGNHWNTNEMNGTGSDTVPVNEQADFIQYTLDDTVDVTIWTLIALSVKPLDQVLENCIQDFRRVTFTSAIE